MGRKRNRRKLRRKLVADDGYLLLTTLFFLIVSIIFTSSMIRISSSQMVQYNQLSHSYQAKAAINISKNLLEKEIENNIYPQSGVVQTSNGEVSITHNEVKDMIHYYFKMDYKNGVTYRDEMIVRKKPVVENEEPLTPEN